MKKEEIFSGKTQGKYLSAAKIICFSFLFSIPVAAFAACGKRGSTAGNSEGNGG